MGLEICGNFEYVITIYKFQWEIFWAFHVKFLLGDLKTSIMVGHL